MGCWDVTDGTYQFRFQAGDFVLIGADYSVMNRASGDLKSYSFNFLTKKRSRSTGNIGKEKSQTTWKAITLPILQTLKTFGQPFTWQIEDDVQL